MAELPAHRLEIILGLTAFAAGTVDIISFAKLGGILASAMTGNLAFLGFYVSRGSFASALSSVIALAGFVTGSAAGTLLSQGRGQRAALRALLLVEVVLLALAVAVWLPTHHRNGSCSGDAVILLLSTAMGMQSITGKRVNLSSVPTIVFTSTLTNIVMALTGMVAWGRMESAADTRRQVAAFLLYFLGALGAGFAVSGQLGILIFLPLVAVAGAAVAGGVRKFNVLE
jgi:uncharacterized membrane protein YoaK (UPF0700 family)